MRSRFVEAIRVVLEAAERGRFRVALIGGFALPFFGIRRATDDVDFLVESAGADFLHEALLATGQKCLNRTADVANYESVDPKRIASVDLLIARRPRALDMVRRARQRPFSAGGFDVPVVDVEGLIGLKIQGATTSKERSLRDRDDIRRLVSRHGAALDLDLLRDYYRLFGVEAEIDELLRELSIRRRRP